MTDDKRAHLQNTTKLQSWLDAYQANQQEIVKAHQDYQTALKDGLDAFLDAMTQTQAQLARVIGHLQDQPQSIDPPNTSIEQVSPTTPQTTHSTPHLSQDQLAQDLLATIALKTGYPQEMLAMDMSLERDLGVDSIKRVEILSALRDQHPSLPEVDANAMAGIETLSDVVQHLNATSFDQVVVDTTPSHVENEPNETLKADDLTVILLDTVANKTGYPSDMLSLDMSLEEDLGIDSIKRVEIFSALRERTPDLPEVDTNNMAQLQTLGDIVHFMSNTLSIAAPNFF